MRFTKKIKTYNETISFTNEGHELSRYTIEGELLRDGNVMYRLLIKQGSVIPQVEEWSFAAKSDTEAIHKATGFINSQVEIIKSSVQHFLENLGAIKE